MNDELMRKISDSLDAEGGLDGDEDLRALLAEDREALAYAQDLVRIDEVLKSFGERTREPDWDALAERIDARLDEELPPLDVDAAPFADEARSAEGVVREAPAAAASAVPAMAAPAMAAPAERAPVVDLASRRKTPVVAWLGGLAAAAAVGLGITFGVTTLDAPAEEMAAGSAAQDLAPPAPSAFPAQAAPAWEPPGERAEAEAAEMPAAATAMPAVAGARAEPTPAPTAPPARRLARSRGPIDDMLLDEPRASGAGRGGGAPAPAPAEPPARVEVLTALRSAEPSVQRCLAERGEVARVNIQVGADGSVVSVRVSPPYVGSEAACIVSALHGVRMPASPTDYPVAYAFRPAPLAGGSLARPPNAARARRRAAPPAAAREADVDNAFAR